MSRPILKSFALLLTLLGAAATGSPAWAAEEAPSAAGPLPTRSGHLPIHGLQLYYEVHGELGKGKTPPLLLIPGAFGSTEAVKPLVAEFVKKRPVIVFDQQGHGRTADTSRKMSYEQFGDDAAALLRALKVERADVLGYSQGGGAALQLAIRHPKLVNKLVSLAATYRKEGWYPSVFKAIESLDAKMFAGSPIEAAFKKMNPDPKAFEAYVEKMKTLNINDQNISDAQMRAIPAKTMVIIGDADGVKPEHAVAMFKLRGGGSEEAAASGQLTTIPNARLAILPATSHLAVAADPALLSSLVTPFLDDVPPLQPAW
ncbi:alpha/beta hydrolase [Archangium violaceum]|uniref:alpha/beta fold hydrolase n=1 Tax=Archangium violaceum TaxID=83451 RepID=UPI002B30A1A9|nr:alpha/beta hydrolase [Archangium gephyra]